MDTQQIVLYFFRKLVYCLYQEVGVLTPKIHTELAKKADIKNAFFQGERQKQAAALYHQTEAEVVPARIIEPYRQRTGLDLEDVHRAFVEGNWKTKFNTYNFGGPKWVRIAELTLELRRLIEKEAWEEASSVVQDVKGIKTNQGYLVNLFEWTERHRNP